MLIVKLLMPPPQLPALVDGAGPGLCEPGSVNTPCADGVQYRHGYVGSTRAQQSPANIAPGIINIGKHMASLS